MYTASIPATVLSVSAIPGKYPENQGEVPYRMFLPDRCDTKKSVYPLKNRSSPVREPPVSERWFSRSVSSDRPDPYPENTDRKSSFEKQKRNRTVHVVRGSFPRKKVPFYSPPAENHGYTPEVLPSDIVPEHCDPEAQ